MIGNHIGCSICCGAGYTINGDVCKCGSAARRLTMNTGPVVLSNEINQLRAENEQLKADLADAKKDAERYRWLRDSSVGPSQIWELLSDDCQPPIMTLKSMHELDAAIDEAMKGK